MAVLPSPLSNSIQGINESTVSGSVFGGNKPDPETKSTLQSLSSSVTSLQNQVNELNKSNITNVGVFTNFQQSFATQINSVSLQLNKVNETLESIATITASESAIEKQKDLYEQEKEKRLAEAGARGGKESILETKIQSALSEPINRIGNKVSFGFQNLMSFIMTLLGGWLTVQGINAIKAYQDGDKKSLEDIKNSVIKTLAIAGGIFGIINIGIGKVISTITGLVAKIGKFLIGGLIIKPFQAVARGLSGGGNKPRTPGPGSKGPVKGPNFLGGALNLYTALRNLGNGEITDAVMQGVLAALLFTPAGRIVSVVRTILGVTVTADEIAEVFGSNIFGENPDILKKAKQVKELAEKEAQENKRNNIIAPSLKKPEPPEPTAAKPVPSTPMTPSANNLQIKPQETPKPPQETPKPPDDARIKQFEQAWQYRNNPMARGRIEGAWDKMSVEEKQQAKDWAKSKNYDWTEMKLTDVSSSNQVSPNVPQNTESSIKSSTESNTSQSSTTAETSSKPSTPEITPAETSRVATVPFNVGPEPEPKPNIVYTSSGSSTPPQQQPLDSGPASDVPAISSSNPDNFYTLYSQINYNVIM